ncbi:MAG: hypothetical protein V3T61_07035 [Acidobacteriota bacterium]
MNFPLKTAVQFHSLDQKKQRLGGQESDLQALIREHLILHSSNAESSSNNLPYLATSAEEISTSQASTMFSFLLELDRKIEELDASALLGLYHSLVAEPAGGYRNEEVQPLISSHVPLAPSGIVPALDRFFEWVRSPSFSEMHPVQQMTLSQIRLCEIYPFSRHCQVTISIFSSYFLLAQVFLPPLYRADQSSDFRRALEQAFLFSTQPLIDLNFEACRRAYDFVLSRVNS